MLVFGNKASVRNRLGVVPGDLGNEIWEKSGRKNLAPFRAVRDVINRGLFELIGSPVMAKGIVFSS